MWGGDPPPPTSLLLKSPLRGNGEDCAELSLLYLSCRKASFDLREGCLGILSANLSIAKISALCPHWVCPHWVSVQVHSHFIQRRLRGLLVISVSESKEVETDLDLVDEAELNLRINY